MLEDIHGLQDLLKKLDDLGSLVKSKNVIARALRAGAEPIREEAGRRAPRGDEAPHAADTMTTVVSDQTAEGAIAKVGPSKAGFYLSFHEWGTAHMSAQPFLRPAFDEKQDEALKLVGEELGRQIEKEMAKL